jgi:hypothetical protein
MMLEDPIYAKVQYNKPYLFLKNQITFSEIFQSTLGRWEEKMSLCYT